MLAGLGATRFVLGLGALIAIPELHHAYAAAGNESSGQAAARHALLFGVWSLFVGTLYVGLALLTSRGSRSARVLSWIFAIILAVGGGGVAMTGAVDLVTWYADLTRVVSALTAVLSIAGVVLLVLPRSRAFFKARTEFTRQARYGPPTYPALTYYAADPRPPGSGEGPRHQAVRPSVPRSIRPPAPPSS